MHRSMNKEAKKRVEQLKKLINHHRYLYHVLDKQEISEDALDSLKHELKKLEETYPKLITPDSPTQRVGGKPLEKFSKVRHQVKQWSLEDAFSKEEIVAWQKRLARLAPEENFDYVCELKIDGLHVILTYEKGKLKTGATRGDGEVGEDVTQNLKTIEAIPLTLAKPIDCIVGGEVFMRKSTLEQLNSQRAKKGEALLANPRNAAAGAIRQLDPRIAAERKLDCFMYDFEWPEQDIPKTQTEELQYLTELGFKVNRHWRHLKTIDQVVAFWETWGKKKGAEDYWIDGAVVKINTKDLQAKLGYTGKSPRFVIAFKFQGEEATTIVERVVPFVGRTGKITPVAFLQPVEIKGTVVSRASLHNYDEVKRLDVREGDTVIVSKAGDVIPQVTKVLRELRRQKAKKVAPPKLCPACNRKLASPKGLVDLFCEHTNCPHTKSKRIVYFFSKQGLDVEGLGEKVINRFIDEGLARNVVDVFDLRQGDIAGLEGFGEKSAQNILQALEEAKHPSLWKFISALGIEHVGAQAALWIARQLSEHKTIRTPKQLLDTFEHTGAEEWEKIEGIGPKVSESLAEFARNKENKALLKELTKRGIMFESQEGRKQSTISGKTFVFTGSLKGVTRGQAQKQVIEGGGSVTSSVSSGVDYVVAGEHPGSKLAKAKKMNIPILNEQEFLKLRKNI